MSAARRPARNSDQFSGSQAARQSFGIGKVILPPPGRFIGVRLRQIELPEMRLQIHPDRLPVLRRRFHYHFFGATLPQPRHEMFSLPHAAAKTTAFILDPLLHSAVDFLLCYCCHYNHQYSLVDVDPRYCPSDDSLSGEEAAGRAVNKIRSATRLFPS